MTAEMELARMLGYRGDDRPLEDVHPARWTRTVVSPFGDDAEAEPAMFLRLEGHGPNLNVWVTQDDWTMIDTPDTGWATELTIRGLWDWIVNYRCDVCGGGRHLPGSDDCTKELL